MSSIKIIGVLLLLIAGPTLADEGRFTALAGNPGLHSASAIVLDSAGNLIYGKDVDTVRPIASITKLMTAIVVLDAELDLNEEITISDDDRDLIRMTGSRLKVGAALTRRDLLLLALMSSENRAAAALGRTYPGGMDNFVAQMNTKAASLGMHNSRFAGPSGLDGPTRPALAGGDAGGGVEHALGLFRGSGVGLSDGTEGEADGDQGGSEKRRVEAEHG